MERRFSYSSNTSRLSIPNADSTRIDGTSTTNRLATLQLQTSLSPKQRSNSSICLSSSYTNGIQKNKELHNLSRPSMSISKTRQKLNLSQLDPKTYADVNSSGLASRVVRYQQESSTGLRRSMSFNSLHTPLMQPRRSSIVSSPLTHKPNLPSLSMTRIAPPERSFYCGNTLPSLLRSNSLLGVEKSNEQLARENRPIMHPTPLQHDCEPTRSVLEELKEISRKRINSGDIPQNDYNSKKSCNRMTDFVDHHAHNHYQHFSQHQQHLSMLQSQSGFKRQRELSVAVPLRLHHAPVVMPQHQQQQHLQQQQLLLSNHNFTSSVSPQQSPEQPAKRRNCSYSNDIASSLSSSKLHTNKRKLYDMREKQRQTYNVSKVSNDANSSGSSSTENSPSQQAAKIQRKQPNTDLRFENLGKTQSTPITPLPATPAQRTGSAPQLQTKSHDIAAPSKPKLTLFNTQHQQQQLAQPALCEGQTLDLESPDVEANEYAGIQFVKPKQQNSFTGIKNSNMERTQKTKLALMLSSLRGEIYLDETEKEPADVTDALPTCKLSQPTPIQPIVVVTTTIATVATTTSTTTAAATTKPIILSVETIVPKPELKTTAATATTVSTSTATPTSSTPSLISFSTPEAAKPTVDKPKELAVTANNLLSGFKLPTTSATSGSTETKNAFLQFNSPTTKAPTTATATATSTAAATPAPALTFGQLTGLAATTTIAPTTTTNSSTAMFSFGAGQTTANTTTTATAAATTTASTPMFSFGQPATAGTSNTSSVVTTTTASAPMFSFGNATTATATTTTTSTAAAATNTLSTAFTFGNATNANVTGTTPATATSVFSADSWAPKTTTANINFNSNNANINSSFGSAFKSPAATTTATSAAEPAKLFGFGTAISSTATTTPAATPAAKPAATSVFGTAAATSTNMFGFNGSMSNAPTTTTAAAATSNSNLFSFGASAAAKPAATATSFAMPNSSNTNMFSFGGNSDANKSATTAAAPAAAATAAASSFSFNSSTAANPATTNTFSFNATPKQSSIFGGPSNNSNNNNNNAAKPFAFGGAQQQPPTAAVTAQAPLQSAAGGFSFATAAQHNESSNVFGSPSASAGKPNFNFGGSPMPTAQATPAPVGNTFGGFAAATQTANQSKPFSFGGGATPASAKTTPSMGGNLFTNAVAAAQSQQQPKSGGFSFSASNNNTNNNSSISSGVQPQGNPNTPFAFGGMTSPAQNTNMVKPFAFGGGATTAQPSNMFGGSTASSVAAPTNNGAFNFGGATANSPVMHNTPQQLNAGNVFAPPSTPENRPIRRATRRLQK